MTRSNVMRSLARTNAFVTAAILAVAALLPVMLLGSSSVSADQLDNRYIDISGGGSVEGSGRSGTTAAGQDVTYEVGFDLNQAQTVRAIVIDFCLNSPIYGDACTGADTDGFDTNEGGLAVTADAGITGTWAVDAATDANTLILTKAGGDALGAGATVQFTLGTTAPADGIDNPDSEGTFYARIVTYDTVANAQGYTSANPEAVGAHIDEGGIALSIANELTVTARVQEVLEFCIGTEADSTITPAAGDDCSDIIGTDLDLGVVDSNNVQRTSDGDILNDGLAMIRTNALNGAVIYYKAEQETGITNGPGSLKQATSECSVTISDVDDPCFNSAGGSVANPSQSAIAAGTELFGMTLTNRSSATGGATTNLSCDAAYDGDGSCGAGAATGYAWDPTGAFDTIASSTGPTDDEMVQLEFAATASPTTPTGLYTVTANFVATSTF